jgi:hypothetical protein
MKGRKLATQRTTLLHVLNFQHGEIVPGASYVILHSRTRTFLPVLISFLRTFNEGPTECATLVVFSA